MSTFAMPLIVRRGLVVLLACLCFPPTADAAIITFTGDPSLFAPGGFFDSTSAEGKDRLVALGDVKTYIEATIINPGTISLSLGVFTDPGSTTLATGGEFYAGVDPKASGVVMGDAHATLLKGAVIAGPHGFILFNTAKDTYLGKDPSGIPSGKTDFRSIVLHEMTHALGWVSYMKTDDKTSRLTDFLKASDPGKYSELGEVYSVYDTLLVDSMSKTIILPSGAANPEALPIGGAKIASINAITANGFELVKTAVIPFIDGDMTHLDGSVFSIMNPTLAKGVIEREWSDIDIGVLKDLGYSISPSVAVPEPSSAAFVLIGVTCLAARRMARRGSRKTSFESAPCKHTVS